MPTVREFLFGGDRRVPKGPLPSVDPLFGWKKKPRTGLRATWLGHSTVLIEIDGLRVLTDPVWGLRASPSQWAGPKRFQPVPVAHPVAAAARRGRSSRTTTTTTSTTHRSARWRRRDVPFVTSLGVGAHLEAWGVPADRIIELDWWESYQLPKADLTVTAAPSQHFSGRGLRSRNSTLWSSMVIRSPRHAVFFSGDTGLTTEYAAIRERLGPFDLVMLEVGAFHPAWGHIHLGPDNALEAWTLLGGARSCRCTGAPSVSRCTRGTSRPRPCWRWARNAARSWSCHGSVNPSSRLTSSACHPGGVRSNGSRDVRSPSRRSRPRFQRICPGRWTDSRPRRGWKSVSRCSVATRRQHRPRYSRHCGSPGSHCWPEPPRRPGR